MQTYCMWPAVCLVNGHTLNVPQSSVSKSVRRDSSPAGSSSLWTPSMRDVPMRQMRALGVPFQNDSLPRTSKQGATRSGRAAHTDSADVDAPDRISIAIRTHACTRVTSRYPRFDEPL